MKNDLVLITQFCIHHEIESSFIFSLQEFGLVTVLEYKNEQYLALEEIGEVEKIIRLHYELGINIEGIDAIFGLLKKVTALQSELQIANSRMEAFVPDSLD